MAEGEIATPHALIGLRALPIWCGKIEIEPLFGGISTESFQVIDDSEICVVRFGDDFPFHHVSRAREVMTTKAAACGLAPALGAFGTWRDGDRVH